MAQKSGNYNISATPATIFAHLLVISVATLVLVWLLHFESGLSFESSIPARILNVHTMLMAIGFVLVSGEAIMAYKTIPAKREVQKTFHSVLQFVALVAAVVGVAAAFKFLHVVNHKHILNYKHMSSLHSWLGMVALCLFFLQYLLGFFSFIFPASQKSRDAILPWHVFGGIAAFLLAICTAELGLHERSIFSSLGVNQEGLIVNFSGLLLFLFGVSVAYVAILPK